MLQVVTSGLGVALKVDRFPSQVLAYEQHLLYVQQASHPRFRLRSLTCQRASYLSSAWSLDLVAQ